MDADVFFLSWVVWNCPPPTPNILWPGKMSLRSLYTNVHSFQWKAPGALMHIVTPRMLFSKMFHWLTKFQQNKVNELRYWILMSNCDYKFILCISGKKKSEEFLNL